MAHKFWDQLSPLEKRHTDFNDLCAARKTFQEHNVDWTNHQAACKLAVQVRHEERIFFYLSNDQIKPKEAQLAVPSHLNPQRVEIFSHWNASADLNSQNQLGELNTIQWIVTTEMIGRIESKMIILLLSFVSRAECSSSIVISRMCFPVLLTTIS